MDCFVARAPRNDGSVGCIYWDETTPSRCILCVPRSGDLVVTLSMRDLGLQRLVNVVALPTHVLVVDLHVERQRELAGRKHRIEMVGQRAKDMLAGLLAGGEIAPFAEPQQHGEKTVVRAAIGDG